MVWDLPFVVFDHEWRGLQQSVHHLIAGGFRNFRLNNLSHFRLFKDAAQLNLEAGYRLFCLNSQAMLGWQELGACSNELYIEDESDNIKALLQRSGDYPLYAMVYGSIPLITSRIRIPGIKGDQPILSDRGDSYQVVKKGALSVLRSHSDFSLCGSISSLQEMGCAGYLIDISHLGAFSQEGKKVLEACRVRRDLPGSSSFNFKAGME